MRQETVLKMILFLTGYYGAEIRVYVDNDDEVNSIRKYDTSKLKKIFISFKNFLFKIYMNTLSKDFGDLSNDCEISKKLL